MLHKVIILCPTIVLATVARNGQVSDSCQKVTMHGGTRTHRCIGAAKNQTSPSIFFVEPGAPPL